MKTKPLIAAVGLTTVLLVTLTGETRAAEAAAKGVLLYSRYYNAEGENRYLPDGTYKEVLKNLRDDFEVRVNGKPPTPETLAGVKLLLIANPSDKRSEERRVGKECRSRWSPYH